MDLPSSCLFGYLTKALLFRYLVDIVDKFEHSAARILVLHAHFTFVLSIHSNVGRMLLDCPEKPKGLDRVRWFTWCLQV